MTGGGGGAGGGAAGGGGKPVSVNQTRLEASLSKASSNITSAPVSDDFTAQQTLPLIVPPLKTSVYEGISFGITPHELS